MMGMEDPIMAISSQVAMASMNPSMMIEDMMADPHYNARGMFESVDVNGSPLKIPAIAPKLSETPGRTDWPGAQIGAHNAEILGDLLGLDATELQTLASDGVTN